MNRKKIILPFLLFISFGAFSQSERGIGNITSLELTEAKDQIDLLQKHVKKIKDELRDCRNPSDENHSERDSEPLLKTGKYYALIITVQDYINEESFKDLKYTRKDGRDLKKVLDTNYEFEEVYILEDPDKEAILKQFNGLKVEVKENDNVLIFYAGHGEKWNTPKIKEGYWCPKNAEYENPLTLMNNSEIIFWLKQLRSRNTLLISDACFGGSIGEDRGVRAPPSAVIQEVYDTESCQYISSGTNTTVPDKSIFIKNLLKALEENTEIYLSASDLFHKKGLKESYVRSDKEWVHPNFSELYEAGHKATGDFIFIKKDK